MAYRYLKLLLAGLTAAMLFGCGGGSAADTAATAATAMSAKIAESAASAVSDALPSPVSNMKVAANNLKGYADTTTIWPGAAVKFCWKLNDSDFAATAEQRQWTHDAFNETWAANSAVTSSGWDQQCPVDGAFDGVAIRVADLQATTNALGTNILSDWRTLAYGYGMTLNFNFMAWDPSDCNFTERYKPCIKTIAAHEFGHVLGFSHEQNRGDTPDTCREQGYNGQPQGPNGNMFISAWDPDSIMNYCNPVWANGGKLSATDIEMVQRFYGKPGGTLYAVTTQRGPVQVITALDLISKKEVGSISLPSDPASLINLVTASPDGKRVYVVSSVTSGTSMVTAIDTATNTVAYTRAVTQNPPASE